MLVHHADASGHCVAGAGEVLRLVIEQDLALVGLIEAVEHVHERGLAGAVFTEQRVHFARFHDEVDVVIRGEGAKALRDAAEFEFHCTRLTQYVRELLA